MISSSLTILGLAYDSDGEPESFAIGFDRKVIGRIYRHGLWFRAKIGWAEGKAMTPTRAAEAAWRAKWGVEPQSHGFAPSSADGVQIAAERVTLRTIENGERYQIYIDGKKNGEVKRTKGGRFSAKIDGTERTGLSPINAARLAWAQKKGLL